MSVGGGTCRRRSPRGSADLWRAMAAEGEGAPSDRDDVPIAPALDVGRRAWPSWCVRRRQAPRFGQRSPRRWGAGQTTLPAGDQARQRIASALTQLPRDEDSGVRIAAIEALGCSATSIPTLDRLLRD